MNEKRLIVVTGPTGVGKTGLAIDLARHLNTEIISADSRQIYRGMPICTAAPTAYEQAAAKHHFVEFLDLDQYYSAAQFEADALTTIAELHSTHRDVVMCGGSMMYVDAVCHGIDDIPTIAESIRQQAQADLLRFGIEKLREELRERDPEYYAIVDLNNAKRVVHALEICRQTGDTYTKLRTGTRKQRNFKILKFGITLPRPQLFERINARVDQMDALGLEDEARRLYPMRNINSLNTVGLKEMFAYFDGIMNRYTAIERIKKNTRVYAKKQLTWYAKDSEIRWTSPTEFRNLIKSL